MTLPLLLSVPHAGLRIPPEVKDLCILREQDIIEDSDEGAAEIYLPLRGAVSALVTTDVARAVVDMNRSEDDRRRDGIVKTHTCYDVPVYRDPLPEERIRPLLERYYRPYHRRLSEAASHVLAGVDCHTMAAQGPPVGPDPGVRRPDVCLSNGEGTIPEDVLLSLAECLEAQMKTGVSINAPFKGGYIIRSHAKEIPWAQLELSRAPFADDEEKGRMVLEALTSWCRNTF
jgi:formiminoglutamase